VQERDHRCYTGLLFLTPVFEKLVNNALDINNKRAKP